MGISAPRVRYYLQGLGVISVFLLGLLSIIATGDGGGGNDGGPGTTPGKVTITGTVKGNAGLPEVTVSAGGETTTTDANGFYELPDVPVPGGDGLLVLTYEKTGYATFQRTLPVAAGETYSVVANLLQYHFNQTIDATQANDLTVLDPANTSGPALAQLSFPAGSLAASGNVTVDVAVGDPTTEDGRAIFPGDYMAASSAGGSADTPLESIAFTEITVTDADGNELTQLNEPATVTVRLPDALQTVYSAGDTIPWWSYDETSATWVREDADPATADLDDAQVIDLNNDGVLYAQAKVTHFTWWNVDKPMNQHACLCTTVVGGNGEPAQGARLLAEGVTYYGVSRPARTDADGRGCVTVKRSMNGATERIKLYVEGGGVSFYYDVTDAGEGDVALDEIFTPTTEGSTIYDTGQCVDLANNIERRFDGVIRGTVTYESTGAPAADFSILTDFGASAVTGADGTYSIDVPVGVPVSLFAVGLVGQTVTVADTTPVTVDFVIPNRAPVINSFTRSPSGGVNSGDTVTLNVSASDPDGDNISYAWSATAGSLDRTDATSVVWTAPATGSGTAEVTVVVSDALGAQTSRTATIVYTEVAQPGSRLSFVIKDQPRSDQPVSGVTVAVYNADDTTIAQTLTSDASGVVDFGDIGRSRATVTIAYVDGMGNRIIETYVGIPVGQNMVYYLDDGSDRDYLDIGTPVASVNVALSDVPQGAAFTMVSPLGSFLTGPGTITNVQVGSAHLQGDGNLSLLGQSFNQDSPPALIGYGYLLDQAVTEGANYALSLATAPTTLGWTTSPAGNLSVMQISGKRNGVEYDLTGMQAPQASSGTLPYASEFPVDYYRILATQYASQGNMQILVSDERFDTLAQTVQITMPDYAISGFGYTDTTRSYSWQIAGTTEKDVITLDIVVPDINFETMTEWTVVLPPDRTSWTLIDLPAPASTWVDTTDTSTLNDDESVSVCDVDVGSGMDDLWLYFVNGGSSDGIGYTRCAELPISFQVGLGSTATRATADGAGDAARVSKPRVLSRLRRR